MNDVMIFSKEGNIKPKTGGKPKNLKQKNSKLVLSTLIEANGSLSASELSRYIGLSKTTVYKILNSFVDKGIVISTGKGSSTEEGGMKPEMFSINNSYRYFISVIYYDSIIKCVITDMNFQVLDIGIKENENLNDYQNFLSVTVRLILELLERNGIEKEKLESIAISCDGIVNADAGIVTYSTRFAWPSFVNLREDIHSRLSFVKSVHIDNGCRHSGKYILSKKKYIKEKCIVVINTLESTGGCIIRNGEIMRGRNGFIGELGHIVLDPKSERKCICGAHGCFESLIYPKSTVEYAKRLLYDSKNSILNDKYDDLTLEDIFEAAEKGDEVARKTIERVAKYFAQLLHNLSLLYDPDVVVIQGAYANNGNYFKKCISNFINEISFYKVKREMAIRYDESDAQQATLRGAAYCLMEQFVTSQFKNSL